MTVGLGADVERHLDALAGVVAGAAHAGQIPVRSEIARAPLGVGLESSAGEDDGPRGDLDEAPGGAGDHAGDGASAVGEQAPRSVPVADVDADLGGAVEEHLHEAGAASHRLDVEPAPEVVLALYLVGLAGEHEDPAYALASHPDDGRARALHEELGHVDVRAALGHP